MKYGVKILSAFLLVMILSAGAFAATPSITMLSSGTCPACAQMSKVLQQIEKEYKGKISTSSINLDKNPDVAKKYNVRYVPMLIFKDSSGKEIAKEVGYRSIKDVKRIFEAAGVKI